MGFCVGVALAFQAAFNPAMHWKVKPEVVICHSSDVSVTRASRAVSYWTHRGYTFGEIRKATRDYMPCVTGEPSYGQIIIDIPSAGFRYGQQLGSTATHWRTDTGEILKAKIEIAGGWESTERVLEHEIGHALGLKDNNETGHIMNKAWISGGTNSRGTERR